MPPCEIRIGTSGWHYKHWLGNFYPQGLPSAQMLAHYVAQFDSVELNNSFYRLPAQTSLVTWRDSTPDAFRFAVKGSRFLTHMKKLKDCQVALDRFLTTIDTLDPKIGPILFQLPPNLRVDAGRLAEFLSILPSYRQYAFEFRHPSWDATEIYELLAKYNAAYCIFDLAGYSSPLQITADFAYVRLHGPGGKYQGSYSEDALATWSGTFGRWRETLSAIYVFFDNDDSGYAAFNALRLRGLVLTGG